MSDILTRSGFYVSVISGKRNGFVLGPYSEHETAINNIERGRTLALELDPFSHFYSFGTCKIIAKELPKSRFGR